MLENAVYSVISPEGCASILWKDASKADVAARNLKMTAEDAKNFGIIEEIISEDQIDKPIFYENIKKKLNDEILLLMKENDLLEKRYERFRAIGRPLVQG